MKGKDIVVGVTGGIAAYKAAELVRLLVREEARVKVAMTANATRFVTPLTFEALSGNRVVWRMFGEDAGAMDHITWGQEADLIILAPATANFIAKVAHGLADDFLSTMVLAATAPILACPAMNTRMYENPVTTENLSSLKSRGLHIMSPGEGQLACRTEGPGRLPEPPDILEEAKGVYRSRIWQGYGSSSRQGPRTNPWTPYGLSATGPPGRWGTPLPRPPAGAGHRSPSSPGPHPSARHAVRPSKTFKPLWKCVRPC